MVYNNNINNANNTYLGKLGKFKDDVVNHPYIMALLVLLFFLVTGYIIYKYAVTNQPLQGYTYYANDIQKLDPLFTETTDNADACISLCQNYSNCDGITYDNNNGTCIGQQNGRLRTDDDNYMAWVKSRNPNQMKLKITGNVSTVSDIKPLISNINSSKYVSIQSKDLPYPPFPDSYSYHFVINIKDWYFNFSYWRHILHKGTPIDKSVNNKNKTINYTNWEMIENDIPEQTIGCWLSPFQNNLRIAVTTISKVPKMLSYEHANIEKCKCQEFNFTNTKSIKDLQKKQDSKLNCTNCWITDQTGDLENDQEKMQDFKEMKSIDYIDIQDLQSNIPMVIDVSIKGSIIEVYINGLYRNSKILNGTATWNNGLLYVHNPKTYKGTLSDLKIISGAVTGEHVKELYNSFVKNY